VEVFDMAKELPKISVAKGFEPDRQKVESVKKSLLAAGVRNCFATFVDVYGIPKSNATPIESFERVAGTRKVRVD
jgi:hypothetical protein